MQVKRLIITPIAKHYKDIVRNNPDTASAALLIKERLSMRFIDDTRVPKVLRKLPKELRGWINPETIVPKNNRFINFV